MSDIDVDVIEQRWRGSNDDLIVADISTLVARIRELEGIIQTIRDDIDENGGGSGYYEVPTEMILGALDGKGFPSDDD